MRHRTSQQQRISRSLALVLAVIAAWAANVSANDFQLGVQAYCSGDYDMARQEFQDLVEAGVARAQTYLGFMYLTGRGVPPDHEAAARRGTAMDSCPEPARDLRQSMRIG